MIKAQDQNTADAFASSWNNLPSGSVYTFEQFEDWFEPLRKEDVKGKSVLELGCGNGSLLTHITSWGPKQVVGVDLGASLKSCKANMQSTGFKNYDLVNHDMTTFESTGFDLVYSIGVIHHLKAPFSGFESVVANTNDGGKFHCWVYAKEGNMVVILFVEPLRKFASKLPWWISKYLIATPLTIPFYAYAKILKWVPLLRKVKRFLPLYDYMRWIQSRPFSFFRHVAFDQIVTPQTVYIEKREIEGWLRSHPNVDLNSTYIEFRNGNSWKFGGKKRENSSPLEKV